MCWGAEGSSDLGNCWEYKWESKWVQILQELQGVYQDSVLLHGGVINLAVRLSQNSWERKRERTCGPAVGNHQSHQPSCLGTFKCRVFNWKGLDLTKGPGYPWERERSETKIEILDKGEHKKTLPSVKTENSAGCRQSQAHPGCSNGWGWLRVTETWLWPWDSSLPSLNSSPFISKTLMMPILEAYAAEMR